MKNALFKYLRKTETYLKTDMVYLVSQGGWLLFGQGTIFISSLLLAWVFANYVDPSDYGLYKYVLSIATIASIASLTGMGTSIAKSVAQNFNIDLFKVLKVQITYGLLGVAGLLALSGYYLFKDNLLLASLFLVTSIWIPFFESLGGYQFYLQGKKDFKTQTYLKIVQRLIISLSLIFVIFHTKSIIAITIAYFSLTTLSHLIALLYTRKKYHPEPESMVEETTHSKIITYGKHITFQNIFFIGAAQLDKILMFKFLGPTQLAIYFFAVALPNEIQGVLGNINSVAFPKLVNKETIDFKIALLKKIGLFTLILTLPALAYILIAPYLFHWLFPVYIDAIFLSQLYIGTILFIPASLIWHYFYATEDKTALWFGTFVGPGVLILGIIIFVPMYGLTGAIIATYIRALIDLISGLYFFFRKKAIT